MLVTFEPSQIQEGRFGKTYFGDERGQNLGLDPVGDDLDPATWQPAPHEILGSPLGDRDRRHGAEHSRHRPLQKPGRCRHRERGLLKCRRPEKVVDDQRHGHSGPPKWRKKGNLVQVLHHHVETLRPESAPEVDRGDER